MVGHEISENVDKTSDGLVSINDILINEGHMNMMVERKRNLYQKLKKKKKVSRLS